MLEITFKIQVKTALEEISHRRRLVAQSRQEQAREMGIDMKEIQEGEGPTRGRR